MTKVRVSAVSFRVGPVTSFAGFAEHVEKLVDASMRMVPDFVVFPELLTFELMTTMEDAPLPDLFRRMSQYTDECLGLFGDLAQRKGVFIVGGTQFKQDEGSFYNTAHLFTPAGEILEQRKCHLTPPEKTVGTQPGDELPVIPTEKAKISILICYDLEFPEAARLVTLQGAEIILSPSATLSQAGYWRVRHCAQARCIEDQVYVVHSSLLGGVGLQDLEFWGNSSILTPCDVGYPPRGIAAEGSWNQEMIVSAELDIDLLYEIRERGAAPTLADRRRDLAEKVCAEGSDRSRWLRAIENAD